MFNVVKVARFVTRLFGLPIQVIVDCIGKIVLNVFEIFLPIPKFLLDNTVEIVDFFLHRRQIQQKSTFNQNDMRVTLHFVTLHAETAKLYQAHNWGGHFLSS